MAININVYGNDDVEDKIKYVYLQERNGSTPYPGTNGNWWIDGKDTGMRAVPNASPNIDIKELEKIVIENLKLDDVILSTKADKIHKHVVNDITDLEVISQDTIKNILGE